MKITALLTLFLLTLIPLALATPQKEAEVIAVTETPAGYLWSTQLGAARIALDAQGNPMFNILVFDTFSGTEPLTSSKDCGALIGSGPLSKKDNSCLTERAADLRVRLLHISGVEGVGVYHRKIFIRRYPLDDFTQIEDELVEILK